ncbi:MAG: cell division protein FtsZ [Rhodospirillaceae bacterium]|nr:cell division protein FtsZ [Rhodospirillaceae bacterium]MBT6405095.1 cell division protein FtsZ [Rhodospirillaceae bacterium]MBT6536658.1 cell division protein FtsZ [Rhodospirillaceae bacterium]MBT7362509.1 cell division protein FtsZ [Rhodospirillaceae bacterium]
MTLNLTAPPPDSQLKPRIVVVGVGGAGSNAVNNMIASNLEGVEFVVANTDAQSLAMNASERRIQLGANITNGLGAGARPDIGRAAAEEALDEIIDHLQGSHMAFIAAGMGGGTGTGAAPVIARAAREQGILTVGVVTKPFQFEGRHRATLADEGIEELQHFVDTLIVIPNQNLFRICNENTTFADAFCMADNVLHSGVRGVTDLMIMPGLINLDFADIRTVMSEMGKAMMGTGEATGDSRAIESAESAIANPLLDDVSMRGARGVLINITGGPDMTLFEVDEAANRIREEVDTDANIIFGSTFDENLEGMMRVSIVATGIDANADALPRSPMISLVHDAEQSKAKQVEAAPEAAPVTDATPPAAKSTEAASATTMPAATTPAPQPQPAATVAEAPSAASPFIPPKPVVEERRPAPRAEAKRPDAFAEAAITNAGVQAERRRGRSLFQKVTGAVNRAMTEDQAEAKPTIEERREPVAAKPAAVEPAKPVDAAPAVAPAIEPVAETVTETVAETVVKAPPAAVTQTVVETVAETVAEVPAQPVVEATVEAPVETVVKTVAEPAPTPVAAPVAPPVATPAPTPEPVAETVVQPTLANIEPAAPRETAREDEDMLEIPAFLRRQAN